MCILEHGSVHGTTRNLLYSGSTDSATSSTTNHQHPIHPTSVEPESLEGWLPSLLRSATRSASRVLLLQHPSSLKCDSDHSLALDFAISLASTEPCRCCHNSDFCEQCVAVTLLVPLRQGRDGSDVDNFPLLCHRREQPPERISVDHSSSSSTPYEVRQQRALRRVQVHHVASLRDVWEYLLQIPGRPVRDHPVGGIVVAGLDQIMAASGGGGQVGLTMRPQQPPQPPLLQDPAEAAIYMTQTGVYFRYQECCGTNPVYSGTLPFCSCSLARSPHTLTL